MGGVVLRDDPRTAGAIAVWERREARSFSPDPKASKRFLGSLYPQEHVLWIGSAMEAAHGRELVVGFTASRLVVAGAGLLSQASAKPKHVVQHRVEGSVTCVMVAGMTVPTAEWRINNLPPHVLTAFLSGTKPRGAPTSGHVGAAGASVWNRAVEPSSASRYLGSSAPEVAQTATPKVGSWNQAEEFAAWHMRTLGFRDARVTSPGADGGIDVIAQGAVAQVKHYETATIGRPVVQQLRGAAHGLPWALFYARSGYAASAVSYADRANVALFTYADDGRVQAASQGAHYLLNIRPAGLDPVVGEFEQFMQAQAQGREAFDGATGEFTAAVRVIRMKLPAASPKKRAAAFNRIKRELDHVEKAIDAVDGRQLALEEVLRQCSQIRAATARVRRIRL